MIVEGPLAGVPSLVLHTRGAKSGDPRTSPVNYYALEHTWFIAATFGGSPQNPAWVHNLRANPKVQVEVGDQTYEVTARELQGAEHERIWQLIAPPGSGFAAFQANVSRLIPVFELVR